MATTRPIAGSWTRSTAPPTSCTAFRTSPFRSVSSVTAPSLRASIYNPATDELFAAEKGKGAFLNDKRRLRVAARKTLANAVVATGIPHRGRPGHPGFMRELQSVMNEVAGIRRTGSAALDLAYTAAGRFDGYWERNLKPWDLAAGIVLLREAGGIVTDIDSGDKMLDKGDVLCGNAAIVKGLAPLLAH